MTDASRGRAVAKVSADQLRAARSRRERDDPVMPALLEFQWPSTAIVNAPIPNAARGIAWIVASMVLVMIGLMGFIPVDQVVTARGMVVSKTSTILVQPLDTAIVRSISVHEGQFVRAGTILAHFDPTFAAADLHALMARVLSLRAEVARLQAQAKGEPYAPLDNDQASTTQKAIYDHEQGEFESKIESYKQKIHELAAVVARSDADVKAFQGRLTAAQDIEHMRKELEAEQFGSHLNTLLATDSRIEVGRSLSDAQAAAQGARRDLAALQAERDAYVQAASSDTEQKLTDATRLLSDATQELNKAQLHRDLVELRADRDAIVQSVAKVSVGSVLQSGQPFITLVPANARLEIEADVSGKDSGFVHLGDPVAIKFDTLPYSQYGMARGVVRVLSPDSFTAQDETRNPTGAVPLPLGNVEPFYRARITVEREALHGVPQGFRVVPGMPVTADIKVGKRTVLQYLLGRLMPYAQEGMREP